MGADFGAAHELVSVRIARCELDTRARGPGGKGGLERLPARSAVAGVERQLRDQCAESPGAHGGVDFDGELPLLDAKVAQDDRLETRTLGLVAPDPGDAGLEDGAGSIKLRFRE